MAVWTADADHDIGITAEADHEVAIDLTPEKESA
jgi:hypothetical protein